jgi:hypothetical protein
MFATILIVAGAVGLVLDRRGALPAAGYDWVPGAATASLLIGGLLLLGRIGRRGGHGTGIAIALGGTAALLSDRFLHWVPSGAQTVVPILAWATIVLGVLVWLGGMWSENGAGGLAAALAGTAVVSVVADSAVDLAAPWDAALNVVTTAGAVGAFAAALAAMGSALSEEDARGSMYTWLGSAVAVALGVAVTAMVAAASFDEPAWVFALLVVLVIAGAAGACASVFLGARAIARNRLLLTELEVLTAQEKARREVYGDEDPYEDEDLVAAHSAPAGTVRRPDAKPVEQPRRSPWHNVTFLMGVTADTIAIVSVIVLAVGTFGR